MGAYGATFFMLTGFHGLHVTIGTIMLIVILIRSIKGTSAPTSLRFEGVSWYWHFVDVVWLCCSCWSTGYRNTAPKNSNKKNRRRGKPAGYAGDWAAHHNGAAVF